MHYRCYTKEKRGFKSGINNIVGRLTGFFSLALCEIFLFSFSDTCQVEGTFLFFFAFYFVIIQLCKYIRGRFRFYLKTRFSKHYDEKIQQIIPGLTNLGLPRCKKNLTRFSLFVSFCFAVRY